MSSGSVGSLSLDLDNLWTYMRIHGDVGWEQYPSYLDTVVPRFLEFLDDRSLSITVFVVGKDATIESNVAALRSIRDAGHEIGNHSFMHEPWLHRYPPEAIESEVSAAHRAITAATGETPVGFRGPGFSLTRSVLESLARHGYRYDTTTLPTFIGPLARRYYFRGTNLSPEEHEERSALFGSFSDGFQPNRPYQWDLTGRRITEIPVTTFPIIRVPFHFSYLLYLSTVSDVAARAYFAAGLKMCRLAKLGPTLLLHPLDFLGADDVPELAFFPGMGMSAVVKTGRLGSYVDRLAGEFDVGPVGRHAATVAAATTKIRSASAATTQQV
jgi:peptidoglycan/xylan/chitin deacetylase (PgdA/CDA1 family)